MINPFDDVLAKQYCEELISSLNENKYIAPDFPIEHLFNKIGCMFGILVCKDSFQNIVVLKAFSGQFNSIWQIKGWCKPLLNIEKYTELVAKTDPEIQKITEILNSTDASNPLFRTLEKKRTFLSKKAFTKIQNLYEFFCADGVSRKFNESILLPTGTGDCCAPKLLHEAFSRNLQPLSLAEFYYGKETKTKKHLSYYPPCDEKCKLILPLMLQLEILYKDEHIVVVNKPAGILSVPGRGEANQDCIVTRIKRIYPECIEQPAVHRLDLDTSGLMVFALTKEAHRNLSMQFEKGTVQKKYRAVLDGNIIEKNSNLKVGSCGVIELPFRLDVENRPCQVYDEKNGKMGITDFKILAIKKNKLFKTSSNYVTYVEYSPKTGRTHQLRLHSAHEKGMGVPIVGDRLYGNAKSEFDNTLYGTNGLKDGRLLLHAFYIEFIHPVTDTRIYFMSDSTF